MQAGVAQGLQRRALLPHAAADGDSCDAGSPRASNAERYSLMRRLTVTAAMQAGVAQGQQCGALLPHAAADGDGAGCGHPGAVL